MTGRRVLIVEDHPLHSELSAFLLVQAGFQVETAANASQALASLPAFLPDVIVLDIQMPGMDGLTLARQLKDQPETRHIPIVALTAYAMKGDEKRMLASGFDGYISKPIEAAHFAERIHRFIGILPSGSQVPEMARPEFVQKRHPDGVDASSDGS